MSEKDVSTRERILDAAELLFAELGFDATPTSRIAELAEVPKGLVHYYFRRKHDLLAALVRHLPEDSLELGTIVVPGDIEQSLRRLVAALDARLDSSLLLSHLLWRESDTHDDVRDAMHGRFDRMVGEIRAVLVAAQPGAAGRGRCGQRGGVARTRGQLPAFGGTATPPTGRSAAAGWSARWPSSPGLCARCRPKPSNPCSALQRSHSRR